MIGNHHILRPKSDRFADPSIDNLPDGILQMVHIVGLVQARNHQTDPIIHVLHHNLLHLSFYHVHVNPPGIVTGTAVKRGLLILVGWLLAGLGK